MKSLLCACLFVSVLPCLHAADALAKTDSAAPTINETEAARIYAEKARERAGGQTDRELLLAISARLFQLEDRLASVEKQSLRDTADLRDGVQVALSQVGEAIGRINAELKKLTDKASTPTPAPGQAIPSAK